MDVDMCSLIDDQVVTTAVPAARKSAHGLHICTWLGTGPTVSVNFSRGSKWTESADYKKIDLGGGVSGFQKVKTAGASECAIKWQHRAISGDVGENMSLNYSYLLSDGTKDDPCGKSLKLVQNALTKLPKP
jgi:hypothetical protein